MSPQVVIIGGGPAGLSAGVGLAKYGVSVLVCDASADPGTKPCGEGLLPGALRELSRLGLSEAELRAAGSPLLGVRYTSFAGQRAEGSFAGGEGLGLERRVLQQMLRTLAESTPGLTLRHADARVIPQADGRLGVRVDGEVVRPRLVIGADGLNSRSRKAARIPFRRLPPFRYGLRQHFAVPCWTKHVEVYWGERAEAYVTPVGRSSVNVAMLWQGEAKGERGVPDLRRTFPELARHLSGATPAGDARAYGPLRVDVPIPATAGLVLLGDAAGYVDAITGEGVGLAVGKARTLVRHLGPALLSGEEQLGMSDFEPYLAAATKLEQHHVRLTRLLLLVRRSPWLLERTIGALASDPQLFDHFLAANQGEISALRLPLRSTFGLARHLTRPSILKTALSSHALRH